MFSDPVTISFPYLDDIADPAIRLTGVGLEIRTERSYYFDNRNRNIDSYIFQYTLEGSGILEADGTTHVLSPGKAFFIYSPSNTKYYAPQDGKPWKFIFVLFMGKSMMPYYEKVVSKRGTVFELNSNSPPVTRAFEIIRDARTGLLSDSLSASSAAFDFVCKLCASEIPSMKYSSLTKKAISLISENFHNAVGISDVASELRVSASHLSRSFVNDTGITPIEYLTKIRINHALRRLLSGDDSVDVIARACGFDNGNYFCKVFKKYMSMTPTEYRKQRKL